MCYIKNFLSCKIIDLSKKIYGNGEINEEKMFGLNMIYNNIPIKFMKPLWYTSAGNINDMTTWASIKTKGNDIYKYNEDYEEAKKNGHFIKKIKCDVIMNFFMQ